MHILDTHTAIWALKDRQLLSDKVKKIMDDVSLPLHISIVSAWEIAVKVSIGKLDFDGGSTNFLDRMRLNGINVLPIREKHLGIVENLPFIHRDPFDRILIATAIAENMAILTDDTNIQKYNVHWIW
jgi:PIN domain nuclease of toxin-antitoxin system